jgi:hypothetical protein
VARIDVCQLFQERRSEDDGAAELNSTAATVLGFPHDGPMAGWTLVAMVEESVGLFWSTTRSQVYREVAT